MSFTLSIQIINEDINQGMTKDRAQSTPSRITLLIDFYSLRSTFRILSMSKLITCLPICLQTAQQFNIRYSQMPCWIFTQLHQFFHISMIDQSSEHRNNSSNHNILVGLDPNQFMLFSIYELFYIIQYIALKKKMQVMVYSF